ncbi:MAG: amidohydrolase [Rhodobacteraceae bacterium]|nr:amidohydrolase [Paracoccaceae bacterium]
MAIVNRIADFADDMTAWRQQLHRQPELGLECHQTAAFVVARLKEFGVDEIHEGFAQSGVVAIINGTGAGPTIGLRADMDALPMTETTGLAYASETPGKMHACGHDGHTTMLLGAAKYLAETRNFAGRVALIFQPGEEGAGGGRIMVQDGIMDRFGIGEVYGIHNSPGLPVGQIETRVGPLLASVAEFDIEITGLGGHGATPHVSRDPIAAALQLGQAIQTIVARNTDALDNLVVSITQIHAGSAYNVIPPSAHLCGTVRCYRKPVQDMVRRRMEEICAGTGLAMGVTARLDFRADYPATVNHAEQTHKAVAVARAVAGAENVDDAAQPIMAGEDFAYMLEARPGAYLFFGQGDTAFVHDPAYDFNDALAPLGASYFARLVETLQPRAA